LKEDERAIRGKKNETISIRVDSVERAPKRKVRKKENARLASPKYFKYPSKIVMGWDIFSGSPKKCLGTYSSSARFSRWIAVNEAEMGGGSRKAHMRSRSLTQVFLLKIGALGRVGFMLE